MASSAEYFLSTRPAYPWSVYPVGLPALALVAAALVGLTLWAYLKHPQATRNRVIVVLTLRLLALIVALITALRPSLGIQEEPKVPSHLLLAIDMSESMSVRDEFNGQTRIEAVRKVLERCEPILNDLRDEQNVTVSLYGFGAPDFTEASGKYDPMAAADGKRSDYGTLLNKLLTRWQGVRFVRGLAVIGDGADNGQLFNALTEAGRLRAAGIPLTTFAVGTQSPPNAVRDVGITAVSVEPDPVPIKNDVTIKATIHAYGFVGARVPVKVSFFDPVKGEFKEEKTDYFTLSKLTGNEVAIKVKAPEKPGEVKVRVEIPKESIPDDAIDSNNEKTTIFTTTKEGVRVLVIDRLRPENARLLDALRADKRMDLYLAVRQTDEPPGPTEAADYDFDSRAYDVIILGNVSARQLTTIDPKLPEKIRDQVTKKGVGLLCLGGEASFAGTPGRPLADGWKGSAIETILPISLTSFPPGSDQVLNDTATFQTIPTAQGLGSYFMKIGDTPEETRKLWDKLNTPQGKLVSRIRGVSRFGNLIGSATVYAFGSSQEALVSVAKNTPQAVPPYLIVGHAVGDSGRGRVLAFAGSDSYLWEVAGLLQDREGMRVHHRFWKQVVLWLAHQELDEGAAFVRPKFRDLQVKGTQTIRVGLRQPGGADAVDPQFEVKVIAPGEKEDAVPNRTPVSDPDGSFRLVYDPTRPGEYVVKVVAKGKDGKGKDVKGEAVARFFASPEVSEEMLRTAADFDFLQKMAAAGGGKPLRLEDLPQFLKDLKAQPLDSVKPKPRFLPEWRRDKSKGFLPIWLVVFVTIVGVEWGLRRLWGMV
ncbi:MAG TPA: hypothetical protein VGJ05_16375 [Fimbriiglobus sp.]